MIEILNEISLLWAGIFYNYFLYNTIFLVILMTVFVFVRKMNIRILNLLALLGLIKLLIPVVNIETSMVGTAGILSGIMPEIIVRPDNNYLNTISSHTILFLLWTISIGLISIYYFKRLSKVYSLKRKSRIIGQTGRTGKIIIKRSNKIHSPFITGLFKLSIVVPSNWDEWPEEYRKAALEHEMAHIKYKDQFTGILQNLVGILNFFNPLVIIFLRKMYEVKEILCDEKAMQSVRMKNLNYSKFLVSAAEKLSLSDKGMLFRPAFSESHKTLKNRIKYHLNNNLDPEGKIRWQSFIIPVVILMLIIPLSIRCSESGINNIISNDETKSNVESSSGSIVAAPIEDNKSGEPEIPEEIPPFLPLENQPKMIGGDAAILRHLKYPEVALKAQIEGQVVIQFVVSKEGVATQFKVIKSLNKACDEAAIEALNKVRFTPAKQREKPVPYRISYPIRFVLK